MSDLGFAAQPVEIAVENRVGSALLCINEPVLRDLRGFSCRRMLLKSSVGRSSGTLVGSGFRALRSLQTQCLMGVGPIYTPTPFQ